jgi:ribosomal protein S18 acetylase RimI-like enzyme
MDWTIRVAELTDASYLPQVENSAGRRFLAIPELTAFAHGEDMPVATHQRYIVQGTEWVAVGENGELLGFLAAEIIAHDLHIWELAVRLDAQNRGIGGQLMAAATAFARERRLQSLTLTTFANVPWNAPWYLRLGFDFDAKSERLASVLQSERDRGWPQRCAMCKPISVSYSACSFAVDEREASAVDAFLSERIYEYNTKTTGYLDGKLFAATHRDVAGVICAGISGYTWGGCCYVAHLWIAEGERGLGLGTALMSEVEKYAQSMGCRQILLASHSFQAPAFYERLGYERQATIQNHPLGHSNVFLRKLISQAA